MIKTANDDSERLKALLNLKQYKICICNASYKGNKNLLGFVLGLLANLIQRLVKPKYDNKKLYIAHSFMVFLKDDKLQTAEMVWDGLKVYPIDNSTTFKKMKKGQLRFFFPPIKDFDLDDFLKKIEQKAFSYSKIGALGSFKAFSCLKLLRSSRDFKNKTFCSEIITKNLLGIHDYLRVRWGSNHPEALDKYLLEEDYKKVFLEISNSRLQWNGF